MSALNRYLEKVKLAGLLKEAMMGNSPLAQKMNMRAGSSMRGMGMGSALPGYKKGGPVKKDGYLTDKKGKPYARVHKGEKVVPKDEKTKQAWAKIAKTVQEKQDVALGSSTLAKELAKPKKRSMVNQLRDFAAKKTRSGRGPNNPLERRSVREAPARYRSGSWKLIPTEDLGRSVHFQRRLKVPGPKGSTPYRTGDRTPSGGIIGKTVFRERSEKPRKVKVIPVPKKAPKPKRPAKDETRYGSKPGMTITLPPAKLVGKAPNLVGDDFKSRAKWLRSRGESWGSKKIRDRWKPGTKKVMNQWWRTRRAAKAVDNAVSPVTSLFPETGKLIKRQFKKKVVDSDALKRRAKTMIARN